MGNIIDVNQSVILSLDFSKNELLGQHIQKIEQVTESDRATQLYKNIIRLAHSFGMKSLVEGVETVKQLDFLREYGCNLVQGYLFSQPVHANELKPIIVQGQVQFEELPS